MTKNLTNTDKFTEAWGFVQGVVVEVLQDLPLFPEGTQENVYIGYLSWVSLASLGQGEDCLFFRHTKDTIKGKPNSDFIVRMVDIKSLRLLSGPWACWQFAPAAAKYALLWDYGGIDFEDQNGLEFLIEGRKDEYGDEYDTKSPKFARLDAPWWWLEAQK